MTLMIAVKFNLNFVDIINVGQILSLLLHKIIFIGTIVMLSRGL